MSASIDFDIATSKMAKINTNIISRTTNELLGADSINMEIVGSERVFVNNTATVNAKLLLPDFAKETEQSLVISTKKLTEGENFVLQARIVLPVVRQKDANTEYTVVRDESDKIFERSLLFDKNTSVYSVSLNNSDLMVVKEYFLRVKSEHSLKNFVFCFKVRSENPLDGKKIENIGTTPSIYCKPVLDTTERRDYSDSHLTPIKCTHTIQGVDADWKIMADKGLFFVDDKYKIYPILSIEATCLKLRFIEPLNLEELRKGCQLISESGKNQVCTYNQNSANMEWVSDARGFGATVVVTLDHIRGEVLQFIANGTVTEPVYTCNSSSADVRKFIIAKNKTESKKLEDRKSKNLEARKEKRKHKNRASGSGTNKTDRSNEDSNEDSEGSEKSDDSKKSKLSENNDHEIESIGEHEDPSIIDQNFNNTETTNAEVIGGMDSFSHDHTETHREEDGDNIQTTLGTDYDTFINGEVSSNSGIDPHGLMPCMLEAISQHSIAPSCVSSSVPLSKEAGISGNDLPAQRQRTPKRPSVHNGGDFIGLEADNDIKKQKTSTEQSREDKTNETSAQSTFRRLILAWNRDCKSRLENHIISAQQFFANLRDAVDEQLQNCIDIVVKLITECVCPVPLTVDLHFFIRQYLMCAHFSDRISDKDMRALVLCSESQNTPYRSNKKTALEHTNHFEYDYLAPPLPKEQLIVLAPNSLISADVFTEKERRCLFLHITQQQTEYVTKAVELLSRIERSRVSADLSKSCRVLKRLIGSNIITHFMDEGCCITFSAWLLEYLNMCYWMNKLTYGSYVFLISRINHLLYASDTVTNKQATTDTLTE